MFLSHNNQKREHTEQRETIKALRGKDQVIYKCRWICITPDFSLETLNARKTWTDAMQTLRDHWCQHRLLYSIKLSITIDGGIKIFPEKFKFKQYIFINPALKNIL